MKKGRVVYIEKPGKVSIKETEIKIESPYDVIVKMHRSSICGTDKNYFEGLERPENPMLGATEIPKQRPLPMGHESCGIAVEVGEAASSIFKPGDPVMSFWWSNAFADYWKAPVRADGFGAVPLPKGMTLDEAALGEPSACAIYAGCASGVVPGDIVAVVGLGFAGQVISQMAKVMGAKTVIGIDIVESKLKKAKELGIDMVFNAKETNVISEIAKLTEKKGVDVAIESAGVSETLQLVTEIVRHGGIIGIYSWFLEEKVAVNISRWHDDGLNIRTLALAHQTSGHFNRKWWVERTLDILASHTVKVEPLISRHFSLEDAQKAFEAATQDRDSIKVTLTP